MLNCTHEEPNGTSPHSYVDSLTGVGLRGRSRREIPSMRATVTAPSTINTRTAEKSASIRSIPPECFNQSRTPLHGIEGREDRLISGNRMYTIDTLHYSTIGPSQPKKSTPRPAFGLGGSRQADRFPVPAYNSTDGRQQREPQAGTSRARGQPRCGRRGPVRRGRRPLRPLPGGEPRRGEILP